MAAQPEDFFARPFPVPDEMPAQLRHGAPAQTPPQRIATLESTGRWTPLAPAVAASVGPQTRGWAGARWGIVRASGVANMLGFTFGRYDAGFVRQTMGAERDRVIDERARVPTVADLDAALSNDLFDAEARERMAYGNRHERDAMLTLLAGMPRLRARAAPFMTTPRGRRLVDGERPLFGCSPDALGEVAPRAGAAPGAAPVQVCIETKCQYGKRAPAPWRVAPYQVTSAAGNVYYARPMERHAHYLVQQHQQMYVTERRYSLYTGWTGTGTRVFRVRYQEATWERTVAFVHDLLATGIGGDISPALFERAKALRAEYKAMTRLANGVMQDLSESGDDAPVQDPESGEFLWPSLYTCETVATGPAPSYAPLPGAAVAWPTIAPDDLPEPCRPVYDQAYFDEIDAIEAAALAARATTTTASTDTPPLSPDLLAPSPSPPSSPIAPYQPVRRAPGAPRRAARPAALEDDDDESGRRRRRRARLLRRRLDDGAGGGNSGYPGSSDLSDSSDSSEDADDGATGGGSTSGRKRRGAPLDAQLGALSIADNRRCAGCGAAGARYVVESAAAEAARVCSLACAAVIGVSFTLPSMLFIGFTSNTSTKYDASSYISSMLVTEPNVTIDMSDPLIAAALADATSTPSKTTRK